MANDRNGWKYKKKQQNWLASNFSLFSVKHTLKYH